MADAKIHSKVMEYIKANTHVCKKERKTPIRDIEFDNIYQRVCSRFFHPPLLNRRKLKRKVLDNIQCIFNDFNSVINSTKIGTLVDDIFEDYKILVEKIEEAERDFNQRKKDYVPDYELLLKKYIDLVVTREGTDCLAYPSDSFNDVEYDFLLNLDKKF